MKRSTAALLCLFLIFTLASCSGTAKENGVTEFSSAFIQQETSEEADAESVPETTVEETVITKPTQTEKVTASKAVTTAAVTTSTVLETIITTSANASSTKSTSSAPNTSTAARTIKNTVPVNHTETKKEKPTEKSVNKKVLVAYFSRSGENYGVGNITKGNTTVVAEMIAQQTNADVYEIIPKVPYPSLYDDCIEYAEAEKKEKARPVLKNKLPSVDKYDVIFLGYPIWFEDCPMPVYTFMEGINWSGKTIAPFCTYGESGICDTENYIKSTCKGAKLLTGYEVKGKTAQNTPDKVKASVIKWLSGLKY